MSVQGISACWGQVAGGEASPTVPADSIFMPADRSVVLLLERTRLLLEDARYAEAARCLDRILSGDEDYFFRPEGDASVHRSIKSQARNLLGAMPPSGRESYELQFGATAASLLDEAVELGDADGLAEVARRFFHTEAGYEASYLLAAHHMDHGRPLVAALTLRRLRDESPKADRYEPSLSLMMARCWLGAGMPDEARQSLDRLQARFRDRSIAIEGREIPLFDGGTDSLDWLIAALGPQSTSRRAELTDWTMHGGSPQRNAAQSGARPLLNVRWRVPTTDYPAVNRLIDRIRRQQEETERMLLPGIHPLVVGKVVLTRTATTLLAIDFETGKRLWEVPADDPFEAALDPVPDRMADSVSALESRLRLRLWGDRVFGTLASDGQLVFSVEGLQLPSSAIYSRALLAQGRIGGAGAQTTYNRLAAFDIRSQGKLRWELGGPRNGDPLPLAGAFFLGPPLPLLGDLYLLAEIDGEVCLLALNADDGELLWQQQLAVVTQTVFNDTLRRVSGVSPSYADGILVCPTSNHSIVALELTTRSLLWGYSYAELETNSQKVPNLFGSIRRRAADPEDRWADSNVVIADGCVLATPTDSDYLLCLSLYDGQLLWKTPREDKLYLAAVSGGNVVVAKRNGLAALSLKDGSTAWQTPPDAWPNGAEPSGRGFSNGKSYFLPLTDSQLMAVDLASGRVLQIDRSRYRQTLGNLVCHDGRVLSQRADGIAAFDQLEALRAEVENRLAADANDARALTLRAEILWEDGRLDEAVEHLRRSLEMEASIHTRSLLRDIMFDGLKQDFVRYEGFSKEIEAQLETADQWATYYRLMAAGYEEAGQFEDALACFRKLVEVDRQEGLYVAVDDDYSLRQDRWIRTRLKRFSDRAPDGLRDRLITWAESSLRDANDVDGPDDLGHLLGYFGALPAAEPYRDRYIERLIESGRETEAEFALIQLARSAGDDDRVAALERWASFLLRIGRAADAAALLTEIEDSRSGVPAGTGEAARHWARQFAALHEAIGDARHRIEWPRGKVEGSISKAEPTGTLPSYGRWPIPFQAGKGVFFAGLTLELLQQPLRIVARDGMGQVKWNFPLTQIAKAEQIAVSRSLMRLDVCGHMLILSVGDRIVALDTIKTTEDGTPTVAWSEALEGYDGNALRRQLYRNQMRRAPGLIGNLHLSSQSSYSLGSALVLGESVVCVRRSRSCAALDPATGETLWQRDRISTQSIVFGDEEHVLIASPQSTTATVLRATDGLELARCELPPPDQRLAMIGRHILCWEPRGREYHLKMIDPLAGEKQRVLWGPYPFPADARWQLLEHDAVAVLAPDGKFRLIRLADGKAIVETQLEANASLTDLVVRRDAQGYVLIANQGVAKRDPTRRVTQVAGVSARRIGVAKIYAFDDRGESRWEAPVVIKDHYLPLIQPQDAPCLTFACMVQRYVPNERHPPKIEIVCVDLRLGRVAFEEEFPSTSHTLEICGQPESSTVEIRMQQQTLKLQFTDEPIPEPTKEGEDAPEEDSDVARDVLKAIWQILLDSSKQDHPGNSAEPGDGAAQFDAPTEWVPPLQPAIPELNPPAEPLRER